MSCKYCDFSKEFGADLFNKPVKALGKLIGEFRVVIDDEGVLSAALEVKDDLLNDGNDIFMGFFENLDLGGYVDIKYCPMCGEKLRLPKKFLVGYDYEEE